MSEAGALDLLDLSDYRGVLVGASLISGKHQRSVKRFIEHHVDALNRMPSAFFSVSGSAGSIDPAGRANARHAMEAFLGSVAWRPDMMTTMAGAMAFTKYSPLLRWVMKQISRRAGGPTDTSRDHELTNWAEVDRFGHAFGRLAAPVTPLGSAHSTSSASKRRRIPVGVSL